MNFEKQGVKLAVVKRHAEIECLRCGKKWRVRVSQVKNDSFHTQAFVSHDGEQFRPYDECPNGCNKGLV